MKIQTFSIVVGNKACNANCPYCVAQMTPENDICKDPNWRNFEIAKKFAKINNVSTTLLTGKGEPTLFPKLILDYCKKLKNDFPFIELQTNGYELIELSKWINKETPPYKPSYLQLCYENGLTTIAISIAHYDSKKNDEILRWKSEQTLNLEKVITKMHEIGFSVRLSCMMLKGYIDSMKEVDNLVNFAKVNNVEQLTIRPIGKPEDSENNEIKKWVEEHIVSEENIEIIKTHINGSGTKLMELAHGAIVYDYRKQNLCLSNCLTIDPNNEIIRQLIFFPDGHLRYDWQYEGAIIL